MNKFILSIILVSSLIACKEDVRYGDKVIISKNCIYKGFTGKIVGVDDELFEIKWYKVEISVEGGRVTEYFRRSGLIIE